MKGTRHLILCIGLVTLLLAPGSEPAFAQKKKIAQTLKNELSNTRKGKGGKYGIKGSTALNRNLGASAALTTGAETSGSLLPPSSTPSAATSTSLNVPDMAPLLPPVLNEAPAVLPPDISPVEDTGTNLTGTQVLAAYFPTWRQELGGMFSPAQLDAVERAMAATDDWLFVRGEDGELQIRNPEEWDYQARFLTILNNSGMSFTEKQMKQLVGARGMRGFTFSPLFLLENTFSFALVYDRIPRMTITEEGLMPSAEELDARAQLGDAHAAELSREMSLGLARRNALKRWPENFPARQALEFLQSQYSVFHTPEETVADVTQFVTLHNALPRQSISLKGKMYSLAELRTLANLGEETAVELAQELEIGSRMRHGLDRWPKDSPAYQTLKQFQDKYLVTVTPEQTLAEVKDFVFLHKDLPRSVIIEGGRAIPLGELQNRLSQGDMDATQLIQELKLGRRMSHYLHILPKNSPIYQEFRKIQQDVKQNIINQRMETLYQNLVTYMQTNLMYPRSGSYLYGSIHHRLKYYQSAMTPDGKYIDPWLQKIYELKTAVENAPKGKFTLTPDGQGGYILEIENPVTEEPDVTVPQPVEEVAPAVPSPHTIRLRINEETKNLVLATRDAAALERREFPGWLRSMHSGENFPQIVDQNTFDALHVLNRAINFDYRNRQNRRAVTYLLETVNNYVGLLGEQPEVGTFYKLMYRGTIAPDMLPQADHFHVVAETQGLSWDGALAPQIEKVNRAYAQAVKRGETPSVYLDGDEELVTALGIEGRVDIQTVKKDFENVIAGLLPPGYTVRMGLHELGILGNNLDKFQKGRVHIHLENASAQADEEGLQIDHSISLDVKVGRFAGWWDAKVRQFYPYSDQEIAENYRTLFDSFLDQEAKDKLNELAD